MLNCSTCFFSFARGNGGGDDVVTPRSAEEALVIS